MASKIELTAADGHRLSAWQDGPADAKFGVVVLQEIFGVNHHMRHVCAEFAAAGAAVVAPAVFDRAEPGVELGYDKDDIARGLALRAKVPESGVVTDVEAAATALQSRLGAVRKVGIIGYCWGGTIAWWGATRTTRFAAAIGWYGGGIAATRTESPHCPVQLHFGEKDASISQTDVEAIRSAQPGVEIFVYPGAQHGFGCEERASYDAASAKLAQQRSLAFFAKHLI
jgi:carboxymethylenebutenolidase